MKKINRFLDMMGFDNYQDLIGIATTPKPIATTIVLFLGGLGGLIETWTGISLYFWLFLTLSSIFDIAFGVYANVVILKAPFESRKFFRGIFKSYIVLFIILITNSLDLGVRHSNIQPEYLKTTFQYMASTIHYSFVMLISLYLLIGISENGAKINMPIFKSLTKILKIRINKVENIGDEYIGNIPENCEKDFPENVKEEL